MSDPAPALISTTPKGLFRDDKNDFSMIRVLAFCGLILAGLLILFGIGLACWEVLREAKSNVGVALAGLGVGIFTSGALAKAWQSQAGN